MTTLSTPPSRRSMLLRSAGLIAATAAPAWLTPALAQTALRPTPSQTEGPYYPVALPADTDFDLLRTGNVAYGKGQPAWIEGVVTDTRGVPVSGAVVEIWQCDQDGNYHHPGDGGKADPAFQGFGRVAVGKDGRYRFRTLKPAPYSGRTPHIHVKVKLDRQDLLTTQFYVQGDPGNARDFLWRRLGEQGQAALTKPFVAGADGLRAEFPIVVQA
ncbi:MAG: protocatechuate 3,4-dioxygenase [Hydrogenophaga sp.]|nr:protocatechuate 3,4-dioxygenase [Hydrogenophaga sp.]